MPADNAIRWIKSSHSFANGNCVQAARLPGGRIAVRDSKNPHGPVLRFTPEKWHAFLAGLRHGDFTSPGTS
jgi:hypothetical protein